MCAPAVPLVLTLASTAIGAYAQYSSASYTAAIANRNAKQAEYLAEDARARGEQKADSERRKVAYKVGAQRVGLAASNVDTGSGMALDIIGDTALLGEMDVQIIRQNADREALGYENQAANYQAEAKAAKSSGLWNTVGTIVGGAADLSGQAKKTYPNFFS
jgi:hypothetical protein